MLVAMAHNGTSCIEDEKKYKTWVGYKTNQILHAYEIHSKRFWFHTLKIMINWSFQQHLERNLLQELFNIFGTKPVALRNSRNSRNQPLKVDSFSLGCIIILLILFINCRKAFFTRK